MLVYKTISIIFVELSNNTKMKNSKINLRFGLIALLIVLAALSRLLPHPPNFAPIAGMGLFGAAYFSKKYYAFLIPFAAYWISDMLLNNIVYTQYYDGFQWMGSLWVYASFALIVALGFVLLRKVSAERLIGASLGSSVLFFLITNFGAWISSTIYAKSFSGLMACYVAGIPFFWNTLAGDLFYVTVLFGVYELVKRQYPQLVAI
jgi:Family of unknown function (DUF6580)